MKLLLKLILSLMLLFLLAVTCTAEDKVTVVLDPGHGGHDPGTIVGTRYESEYINDLTSHLKKYLEESGKFDVYVTRGENEYLKYLPRALVAERVDADILISLHFNSSDSSKKNGVEVLASVLDEWYPKTLSESITASISKKCGLTDSGVVRNADTGDERGIYYWHDDVQWDIPGKISSRKSDYYSIISWGAKLGFPSVIVEHAYLSNTSDLAFCDSADGMEKLARAEADAIIAYYTGHTHIYGELTCDRMANCCLEGVYSRKCTVCGHRTDVTRTPVNASLHGWTEQSRSAGCTVDGFISRECQISRNLSEKGLPETPVHTYYEILPAYGHDINVDFERVAAHAVDGYKKESCVNCGEVWEYFTAGEPHTFEAVDRAEPDCVTDGYEAFICRICEYEETKVFPALGHDYGEKIGEIGCDFAEPEITYTCTRCSDTVTETVQIPPHKLTLQSTHPASCDEDGFEKYVCEVCGYEETAVLAALGHDYGEGELTRNAGYFSEGELTYTCSRESSHVITESTPRKEGGIFMIIAAVSGAVLVVGAVTFLFVRSARRRLSETAKAAELLMHGEAESLGKGEAKETEEVTEDVESENITD